MNVWSSNLQQAMSYWSCRQAWDWDKLVSASERLEKRTVWAKRQETLYDVRWHLLTAATGYMNYRFQAAGVNWSYWTIAQYIFPWVSG